MGGAETTTPTLQNANKMENADPQNDGPAPMELDGPGAGSSAKSGGSKNNETQLPWVEKYRPKR